MPIEHPSMRRTKETLSQPKPETLTVEDALPMTEPMVIPQHILSGSAPEPINDAAGPEIADVLDPMRKVQLEDLIFLGRISKVVSVGNLSFEVSTLTHDENTALMKSLYGFEGGADLFTIRSLTLAHAIRKVNGMPLDAIDIDGEFSSVYSKKLAILNSMQKSIIEKLHDDFVELSEESEKNLSGEEIKN